MEKLLLTTEADAKGFALVERATFPDGDSYVRLPLPAKDKDVLFFARCYPQQNQKLMEFMLAISAARDGGARHIRAFVPYLPYARQDKIVKEGEAISSQTVCALLKAAGLDELITLDCHFLKKSGVFEHSGLTITNVSAAPMLLDAAKKGISSPLVITPDQGAAYLAKGEKGAQSMQKTRGDYDKSHANSNAKGKNDAQPSIYRPVASLTADFNVKGRDILIIDDIVAGGSTMMKAVQLCKKGGAKSITCACTHGQFLAGADRKLKKAGARKVISTDSIITKNSVVKCLEVVKEAL